MMMYQILCGHVNYALGKTTGARGTTYHPHFLIVRVNIHTILC